MKNKENKNAWDNGENTLLLCGELMFFLSRFFRSTQIDFIFPVKCKCGVPVKRSFFVCEASHIVFTWPSLEKSANF